MLDNNGSEGTQAVAGQEAVFNQTVGAGTEQAKAAEAVDVNVISASFNFRPIAASAKDNKMALEMAKFDAANASYVVTREVTNDPESPIDNIKRDAVTLKYPRITVEALFEVKPELVQQLLDAELQSMIKSKYVDECLTIDPAAVTVDALINFCSSTREAAISKEQVEAVMKQVTLFLTAKQLNASSMNVIVSICKGRFSRRVLDSFNKHTAQFEGVLATVFGCFAELSEEVVAEHMPVLESYQRNLENYLKPAEEELDELELIVG